MGYHTQQIEHFTREYRALLERLEWLPIRFIQAADAIDSQHAQRHLKHGAGRRIGTIKRALENVFSVFPLATAAPLSRDCLADAQINLQAFLVNVYGFYDNCAWAFVHRHELADFISNRHKVGMFHKQFVRELPGGLRELIAQSERWFNDYLKNYRDALAHRIAVYIPPSEISPSDSQRFQDLEAEKIEWLRKADFDKINEIEREQRALQRPSFMFLHAYDEDGQPPKPLLLHPQMLTDVLTLIEFSEVFLTHWHERPSVT